MDVLDTASVLQAGYAAPSCAGSEGTSSTLFAPIGFRLWLLVARLDRGAALEWLPAHGDEAVYVTRGALAVDGTTCAAGGAVIVESSVPAVARAAEPTEVVHVGPRLAEPPADGPLGPVARTGHGVHVITADQADAIELPAMTHAYFADSTCATCRIAFFRIDGSNGYETPSHLHSEDEIIYVLSGALRVGPQVIDAGMAIAIPAQRRYAFRASGAFSFLNYRADASTVVTAPDAAPFLETASSLRSRRAQH